MKEHFTTVFEAIGPEVNPSYDFALILNAPPVVALALDDIRRRYDPAYKTGIPPHITIKRPAPLGDTGKIPALQQDLRQVAHSAAPILVQLQGYGIFRSTGRNVLFLKVKDEKPFCDLHKHALAVLSQHYPNGQADHFEGDLYHPHLTIGNELSDLDLAVLEHELTTGGYQLDFTFTLTQLTFFIHPPGQPWQIIENFELNHNLK